MDLNVLADSGARTINVADEVMNAEYNEALVHQVVVSYMATGRSGTKAQKTRSEVRGGGAKPWKQKGTGRARAGTIRSPIWRKGGVTFAAKPRSYNKKINKKVYNKALCCILAELYRNDSLKVISDLDNKSPKTKDFVAKLASINPNGKSALIITNEVTESLYLASRNVVNVGVIDTYEVNPYILMKYENVIVTESAMQQLEGRLK